MYPSLKIPAVLGLAICFASCEVGGAAHPGTTPLVSPAPVAAQETETATRGERKTTSSEIALSNLSSQISSFQQRVGRIPADISSRETLVGLLLARTQYLGTYDDFDAAFQLAKDAIEQKQAPARAAILHARVLSAVHRFKAASAELDRAESLGSSATQPLRETIALATGQHFAAITESRAQVADELPSYASLTKLAASLTKSERFEESDAAYHEALARYRDVSPLPMAWVAFQRGVIWGELADDSQRAYEQYHLAVARLPQYIVGNVHLSEIEVERGEAEAAIARLERIVNTTVDPEPASRLAEYLSEADPERAARYRAQAHAGYQELLARYPLAFADHATEFYLGAGDDAQRALELALVNLGNRKTSRAYGLAIEAATAASRPALACKLVREAKLPTHGSCRPSPTL